MVKKSVECGLCTGIMHYTEVIPQHRVGRLSLTLVFVVAARMMTPSIVLLVLTTTTRNGAND